MDQKESVKNGKRRCKNCNSKFVYIRIKDRQKVCRSCGYIENLDKQEDKE